MTTLLAPTPGQTIGPFYGFALPIDRQRAGAATDPTRHTFSRSCARTATANPVPDVIFRDLAGRRGRERPASRVSCAATAGVQRGAGIHRRRRAFPASAPSNPVRPRADRRSSWSRYSAADCSTACSPAPTSPRRRSRRRIARQSAEDRRDTLIAERDAQGLRFDIRLQGERETVFLSYPGQ